MIATTADSALGPDLLAEADLVDEEELVHRVGAAG